MAEEKLGIQETKEVLIALNEVSLLVITLVKDGVQLSDGVELVEQLLTNPELKAALEKAIDGITKVPAEIVDIDGKEGSELASEEFSRFIPKLMDALKA